MGEKMMKGWKKNNTPIEWPVLKYRLVWSLFGTLTSGTIFLMFSITWTLSWRVSSFLALLIASWVSFTALSVASLTTRKFSTISFPWLYSLSDSHCSTGTFRNSHPILVIEKRPRVFANKMRELQWAVTYIREPGLLESSTISLATYLLFFFQ